MPKKTPFLIRLIWFFIGVIITLAILFFGFTISYWLGWPMPVRNYGSVAFVVVLLALWFLPMPRKGLRRTAVVVSLVAMSVAFAAKTPQEQDWIPLHEKHAKAVIDGDTVVISNFRDALHTMDGPSTPRWITETFQLSELDGVEFILQPFGNWRGIAHALLSFSFSDGRHIVLSVESRRATGGGFDPLAGFFRHDQAYPVLSTERDQFWERLSRTPPLEMQFYELQGSPEAMEEYFLRVLDFANEIHEQPRFYNTLRESCLTALIRLAPEAFANVPWFDMRQWIPGFIVGLLQDIGLVDNSLPPDEISVRQRLRGDIAPPNDFADDRAWSAYLRSGAPFQQALFSPAAGSESRF